VPVGDAQALADAMAALAQQPEQIARFGAASRAVAEAKYDVRLVTAEIMAFLGLHQAAEPGPALVRMAETQPTESIAP